VNEHLQDLRAGGRPMKKWKIELEEKDKEIERLNNIIKEVREYIKAEKVIKEGNKLEQITNYEKKLLEMLDKENKE
jgi:flagellin-specific chaperone FliS